MHCICISALAQPDDVFINQGFIDERLELPINATTFINEGSFTVLSEFPFDTMNTLNYTNLGIMSGFVGFNFENIDDAGNRAPAATFFNGIGSEINAVSDSLPTLINIDAQHVENHGLLSVGSSGLISITGDNVNLANSGLGVVAIRGSGTASSGTNYSSDAGIYDNYWGGLTNGLVDSSGLLNMVGESANLTSPAHIVSNAFGFNSALVRLQGADTFIYTNAPNETNIIVQAVFSSLGDPKIETQVRFTPSTITNNITTATVEYRVPLTNVVTGSMDLFTLYLKDTLAWDTNLVMEYNIDAGTFKPSTYQLSRLAPMEWLDGSTPNGELVPDLLWQDTFTNTIVTNFYTAYQAVVANTASTFVNSPSIPLEDQAAGRIEIKAKSLDLSNLRIRGEGLVSIETDHLMNLGGAVVDVENANYSLASTNSMLNIDELAVPVVDRFAGALTAYSMIWTNQSGIVVTNPPADENSEETMTTNVVNHFFHIMMVDASNLKTIAEVFTHDFKAKAETVHIADDFQIVRSFEVESENVTLDSDIALFSRITNIGATNFVNLLNFTNLGALSVNEVARFGTDRTNQLNTFVNRGALNAFSQRIKSRVFSNSGQMASGGRIEIEAESAKLDQGSIIAGRDLRLSGGNYKLRKATLDTSAKLYLDVHGVITDGGPTADNNIIVRNGFQMLQKPEGGDLLGTFISSQIPRFANVEHVWQGDDLGPSSAGFKNNAAIGTFEITGPAGTRATFTGRGANTALYVDFLQFGDSFIENWDTHIHFDPNFTLYFAGSNIPVHELDGAFGGRLQWVQSYAGPKTSVPVVLSDGTSIIVNRSRKESLVLDDDGDGVANGIDAAPFDGVVFTEITVNQEANAGASIEWMAAGNTSYRIEYTNDVKSKQWNYLKTIKNTSSDRRLIGITDSMTAEQTQKYYRVTYQP